MPRIDFPYGPEHLSLDIVQDRLPGVLLSQMHSYEPPLPQKELIKKALEDG